MSAVIADAVHRPGIRYGLSFDAYNALPGIRAGHLSRMRRSPLHYQSALSFDERTAPMRLGTAAHCAVLEPERFEREYIAWTRKSEEGNACPRRGKYWEAFQVEHPGKEILTEQEMETAITLSCVVERCEEAMAYLRTGKAEVTLFGEVTLSSIVDARYDGLTRQAKARPDWLHIDGGHHVLVGLKTARDASPLVFGNAAYRLGYHISWAWYFDLYRSLTGIEAEVREIVVENNPPYDVVVYKITPDIIHQGRDDYQALLRQLVQCERDQCYPGASAGKEVELTLPSWAYPSDSDIGDLGLEPIA
jgi:exodeoxyribonuclease VIII